jgi:hypothetical protein
MEPVRRFVSQVGKKLKSVVCVASKKNCKSASPTHHARHARRQVHHLARQGARRPVAVQVDPFESEVLKRGNHLIGARVETRRFQARGLKTGHHITGRLKGQAQGLTPGGFKRRVNWISPLVLLPHRPGLRRRGFVRRRQSRSALGVAAQNGIGKAKQRLETGF